MHRERADLREANSGNRDECHVKSIEKRHSFQKVVPKGAGHKNAQ
jgi:hypothetical protein